MTVIFLYTTHPNQQEAEKIAQHLLRNRLIACANILPTGTSLYRWEGEIEHSSETVMIIKTTQELVQKTTDAIIDLHPYECPCVVELAASGGNPDFLNWVKNQVS